MMKNKKIFIVIAIILVIILLILTWKIFLPKYYLNKALDLIDSENYIESLEMAEKSNSDEYKKRTEAIIVSLYMNEITNIANSMNTIMENTNNLYSTYTDMINNGNVDKDNIDYSADDKITESVNELVEKVNNSKFSSDILPEEANSINEKYEKLILNDFKNAYTEPLDKLKNLDKLQTYVKELSDISYSCYEIASDIENFSNSYNFSYVTEEDIERFAL